MAFCKNCGAEIDDNVSICMKCGVPQNPISDVIDKGGFLWGLLGYFVPLAGLVIFLIWRDTKPKTAKAAGIGALVSVIVSVVLVILYIVFLIVIFSTAV